MYTPAHFVEDRPDELRRLIEFNPLGALVRVGPSGLDADHVPFELEGPAGEGGLLRAHVARANPQWKLVPRGEAMAIFGGPQAYVTPSWYPTKQETHKVVPTWNYVAIHAYGPVEFFDDAERLLGIVTRLTDLHETSRPQPWAVTDAPSDFIKAQLRGIVGLRMPITRLDAKRKMSQNRSAEDRAGVIEGLSASDRAEDRHVASLMTKD